MPTITPTVGRKVYFYEHKNQAEPHDATIIKVWSQPESATPESVVNLFVIDGNGNTSVRTSVRAYDEAVDWPHFRWMPYQVGQAKPAPAPAPAEAPVQHTEDPDHAPA